MPSPRTSSRRAAVLGLLLAAVALLLALRSGDGADHHVFARVPDATNVIKGQKIREGGRQVGEIAGIRVVDLDGGRGAELELALEDAAWPLPKDSRFRLRWGGTVKFSDRYVALTRGANRSATVPDGSVLARTQFTVPVEFDQLLATFDTGTRKDLKRFLDTAGATLLKARPGLETTVAHAPGAVQETEALLGDLDRNRLRLSSLVRSGSRVVDAVQTADPGVGQLVTGAATTMHALADRERALAQTLEQAPTTFTNVRTTLKTADPTLRRTAAVLTDLRPGVQQLRRIATPLNRLLGTVVDVAPQARATLRTARRATPDLNPLLDEVTRRMPQLASISDRASKELDCIRPYTPEIAAFASNWGGFTGGFDGRDRYARVNIQALPFAPVNAMQYGTGEAAKLFPGIRMGMPRPPGALAGQPWFLPECGAGPDALDPQKDPEDRRRKDG
jgi:phospholipid/cholesterol/gamma-HCH transport system substrate-binding protein